VILKFCNGSVVLDGRDETRCCASNGVTGHCLAVCSGNITNFPSQITDCQPYINAYALCYNTQQSTTVAPTTSIDCKYCFIVMLYMYTDYSRHL